MTETAIITAYLAIGFVIGGYALADSQKNEIDGGEVAFIAVIWPIVLAITLGMWIYDKANPTQDNNEDQ